MSRPPALYRERRRCRPAGTREPDWTGLKFYLVLREFQEAPVRELIGVSV